MSQKQPQREDQQQQQKPIKYGDVFNVSGELASKPVTPGDAATMQASESIVLGQTQKGGPAAVMQSAATENEKAGLISHGAVTNIARDQGVSVDKTVAEDGTRVITESVGDQVVAEYAVPEVGTGTPGKTLDPDSVTVGEALEATSLSIGDKPVDQSDAAAINAAEMRAMGSNQIQPGGVGATAQSAATQNERTLYDGAKTTISDVLSHATTKLRDDKAVTRKDADGVISVEMRNKADMRITPGGIGASMAAAARLNENKGD